jgi:dTDP-4-dehydrorhamnose 3,5-epimerase-like enzyme
MIQENKKPNFTDDRGTIMDIFVNRPFEHCVIVRSRKGSVRGNHYHKLSFQCDFMVSGKMAVFSRKEGSDVIEERVVGPNEWVEWEKSEVHEFIALDDDVAFVTFVNGPRGGDNYESDTFRLPVPLHELKGRSIEDILQG